MVFGDWPKAAAAANRNTGRCRIRINLALWEHQIDVAPILGGARALLGPVGCVVEMVGDLRRPETTHIAIIKIAFGRLAETRRSAGRVDFPTRREDDRAT